MKKKISIATIVLAAVLSIPSFVPGRTTPAVEPVKFHADSYYRTDLFFGRSIPGGGMVSDEEWEKFLAEVVTPRFPDGFTIVNATGQYREKNSKVDKEPSEVLIFLYPASRRTASRRKIEEIRQTYVKTFRQESVLRLDFRRGVNVYF